MTAFSHNLHQVTYPRMVRQDLTQSQLGSFKFTPIDETNCRFPTFTPRGARQSENSAGENTRVGCSVTHSPALSTAVSFGPATSPNRPNPTFFNEFVKPDLDKFRLRSGPLALRAAVDSVPVSPSGREHNTNEVQLPNPDNLQPTMVAQDENYWVKRPTTESTRESAILDDDLAQSDFRLLNTSLVRALASEQQAHQVTKIALDKERNDRMKAEADLCRYMEHNRSLIGSVNMLKSVIQHNMKKDQEAFGKAVIRDHSKKTQESAQKTIKDHYKNFQEKAKNAVIDNYYKKAQAASQSVTVQQDTIETQQKPLPVSDSEPVANLYDFDLLEKQNPRSAVRTDTHPIKSSSSRASQGRTIDKLITISDDETEPFIEPVQCRDTAETDAASISNTTTVEESNNTESKLKCPPKLMAMPFDVHVQWNQCQMFDDADDKLHRLGSNNASVFAEHPVRYFPSKADRNIYRTIMIDFIPLETTYKEILDEIRGGTVESIHLYGPIGRSTSFMTARIVFTYELGAREVYMRGQSAGIKIRGHQVRVWQVLEATYPRHREVERAIFEEGYTRLLLIENALPESLDKLPEKFSAQIQSGAVVEIGEAFDNIPMIEFNSIYECATALEQLINDPDFSGSRFDFEEDYCNGSYV